MSAKTGQRFILVSCFTKTGSLLTPSLLEQYVSVSTFINMEQIPRSIRRDTSPWPTWMAGQGFRVYDGWGVQAMYIRNGYNHLITSSGAASNGGQYREVRGREGEATTNSDVWGWCTVHFNGSFTMNWLRKIRGTQRPDHKTHSMFPHRNPLVLTNQTPARKNG